MSRFTLVAKVGGGFVFIAIAFVLSTSFLSMVGLIPEPEVSGAIGFAEFKYYLDLADPRIRDLWSLSLYDENADGYFQGSYYLDYANHYGDGNFGTIYANTAFITNLYAIDVNVTDLNVLGDINATGDLAIDGRAFLGELSVAGDANFAIVGIGSQEGTNPLLCFYHTGAIDACLEYRTVGSRFFLEQGITIDGTVVTDEIVTEVWRADTGGDDVRFNPVDNNWSFLIGDEDIFQVSGTDSNIFSNFWVEGNTFMEGSLNVGGNIFSESGDVNFVGDINVGGDANFWRVGIYDIWSYNHIYATTIGDRFGLGGWIDFRGDPYGVQGVDFQIQQDFEVQGDTNVVDIGISGAIYAISADNKLIWNSALPSLVMGFDDADVMTATAMGSTAVGMNSGGSMTASGDGSFAGGRSNMSTMLSAGEGSFVYGYALALMQAYGWGAIAMGLDAKAFGNGAIALGYDTNATGQGSFAAGSGSSAIGQASAVIGDGLTNYNANSLLVQDLNVLGDLNAANMTISGITFADGGINVTGDSNFASIEADNAYLGTTTLSGNLTLGDNNITFGVTNHDSEISGLPICFATSPGGSNRLCIGLGGDVNMNGTFYNGGNFWNVGDGYFHDDVIINDDLEVGGDLNVVGDINFGGSLAIEGLSFSEGGIVATGDSNFTNIGLSGDLFGTSSFIAGVDRIQCDTCTASGTDSTALGSNATASNTGSFADGISTTASGLYSTAFGSTTTASGDASAVMGFETTASGDYSFAVGLGTTASGTGAFSWGWEFLDNIHASGDGSMAGGYDNMALIESRGDGSIAVGYSDSNLFAGGTGSVALGYNVKALGEASVALGKDVTCYADNQICVQDLNVLGDGNFINLGISGTLFGGSPAPLSIRDDVNIIGDLNVWGNITFKPVERHWIIHAGTFAKKTAGPSPGDSSEGSFITVNFDEDTNESLYATEHYPFRAAEGADIELEIAWLHNTGADTGKAEWCIEYKAVGTGDTVAGGTTINCQASAGNHAAGEEIRTEFTTAISTAGWTADDGIGIKFYRGATSVNDTLAEDGRVIGVHFHFLQDKLGS